METYLKIRSANNSSNKITKKYVLQKFNFINNVMHKFEHKLISSYSLARVCHMWLGIFYMPFPCSAECKRFLPVVIRN